MDQIIHVILCQETPIIKTDKGEVLKILQSDSKGFLGLGEAYFSVVYKDAIKGWKRHTKMILNIVVPIGCIKFVVCDDRDKTTLPVFKEFILSRNNYCRLTIPPMVWFAFQGLGDGDNILLNIASIKHDPNEAENVLINHFQYEWDN